MQKEELLHLHMLMIQVKKYYEHIEKLNFDLLIPNIHSINLFSTILIFITGLVLTHIISSYLDKKSRETSNLLKIGIISTICLILHNIPEGLVLGVAYGSIVYIQDYGYFIAEDCGGAIKENRIDIYTNSHSYAIQQGKKVANVWILGKI